MIDQSHNVEGKIDAMIQSVMNIQTAYAKALLVDEKRLAEAQREGDVLGAHRVLLEAFETDVRPLLARLRAATRRRARSRRGVPSRRPRRTARARARDGLGRKRVRADDDPAQRVRPSCASGQDRRVRRRAPERLAGDARRAPRAQASGTTRSSATATRCSGTSRRTTSKRRQRTRETQEVNARWQDAMADLLEERVPGRRAAGARRDLPSRLNRVHGDSSSRSAARGR